MSVTQPTGGVGFPSTREQPGETNTPISRPNPLGLTDAARRFTNAAADIEMVPAVTAGTVGYVAKIWARYSLPYKNPGQISRWERRNGDERLVVRPSLQTDADGNDVDVIPYGVVPRYVLAWMVTQAVTSKNPTLEMGASLSAFMRQVGMGDGGAQRRMFRAQTAALVDAAVSVRRQIKVATGEVVRGNAYTVAENFNLWLPGSDTHVDSAVAWPDNITLSSAFYRELVDARSPGVVPVDLRVLGALAGSPMAIDQYVWLTYRMSYLRKPSLIRWHLLDQQFGSQTGRQGAGRERRFRQTFRDNLERKVSTLYGAAEFKFEKEGLRLFPSTPHIPRRAGMRRDQEGA